MSEDSYLEGTDSEISNLSTITLESKELIRENLSIKRIKFNRNKPRIKYGKYRDSIAFDIELCDTEKYKVIREPIKTLINIKT